MTETSKRTEYEFGGPIGCLIIMIISPIIPYYLWYCIQFNNSSLALPSFEMIQKILTVATPTRTGTIFYLSFILFEAILAWIIPGFYVLGLPLKHEGDKKLVYNCNAIQSWYITLILVFILHFTKLAPISLLMDNYAPILTVSVIFSKVLSVLCYYIAILLKKDHRMTGNFIYDFFMGAPLNPRLGSLDIKMFAEARISWILLFLLTLSSASKQYEEFGFVSTPMIFMIVAHGLYTNAIMKGEECIPSTWDMFYEKYGWMLCFWNFSGVPFVYCIQSFYIYKNTLKIQLSPMYMTFLFVTLAFAYYVWDTSQSQRNRFRMSKNGSYKPRNTFPQLPWGTLEKPEYLTTKAGSELLIDGWWRYARKIHYTADIYMALSWGLACGFGSFIPYFYVVFFTSMIIHRALRDIDRCQRKYGNDWNIYCQKVPYLFIPYLF